MIYKVAGDKSVLDDLLTIINGWKKIKEGGHYKCYPPPEIINGEKFPIIWAENDPRYSGEVFITYSRSRGGRNRNEVRSWNRVFDRLDKFPHMIDFYNGRKPSEVFNTEVLLKNKKGLNEEERNKRNAEKEALKKEKARMRNTLHGFHILSPEFTYLQEDYYELYENILELEKLIEEKQPLIESVKKTIVTQQGHINKLKGGRYDSSANQKLKEEAEAKKDQYENEIKDIKRQIEELHPKDVKYVYKKIEKDDCEFSIIDSKNQKSVDDFYHGCLFASGENSPICVNHTVNIESGAYDVIAEYMGLPKDEETYENISGTLHRLILENKVTVDNLGDIIFSNQTVNEKLATLFKVLRLLKTGKLNF